MHLSNPVLMSWMWLNLLGVWILGHTNQIFVEEFHALQVFSHILFVLVASTTDHNMLKELEDKLFLVLVFVQGLLGLDVLILHGFFPEHSLYQLVAERDAFINSSISTLVYPFSPQTLISLRTSKWHVQNIRYHMSVIETSALSNAQPR